jgi:single-strand DNA-binding protein
VNNLSIVGRIGKVGDLRYTQSGKAVINLSVAVDNGKDANGEKRAATWFEVALWEKQAEALAEYLVVGDRVGINGQIRLQVDEGKDGQKYPKLTVDFPRVELLGGSSKPEQTQQANRAPANRQQARPAQQTGRPAQRQAAPVAVADDEDIPF